MNNLHVFYQAQGALIRKYRRAAGVDQETWAARLGIRQSRVSVMERGSRATLAAHSDAISRELELPWDEICRRADIVAAHARAAAQAVGLRDLDAVDPDARYGLVRFIAEVVPSDHASTQATPEV